MEVGFHFNFGLGGRYVDRCLDLFLFSGGLGWPAFEFLGAKFYLTFFDFLKKIFLNFFSIFFNLKIFLI